MRDEQPKHEARIDASDWTKKPWDQRTSFEQGATFTRQVLNDTVRFTILFVAWGFGLVVVGLALIYVLYLFSN